MKSNLTSKILLTAGALTPASVLATTGLGSLEGVFTGFILLAVIGLLLLVGLCWGIVKLIKLFKSKDPEKIRSGKIILSIAGIFVWLLSTLFVDYSWYLLKDNVLDDEYTVTRALNRRYIELSDGRAIYARNADALNINAGEDIVLRFNESGQLKAHHVEIWNSQSYRWRSRKMLSIPILPRIKSTRVVSYYGTPVVLLEADWQSSDIVDPLISTPINWCCGLQWATLLLERGADPNQLSHDGRLQFTDALRPLAYVKAAKELEEVEAVLNLLLGAGLDVNLIDGNGSTALHGAASYGSEESIKWLLAHGADASLKNHRGQTPMDLLIEQDNRPSQYRSEADIKKYQNMKELLLNALQ